MSSSRPTLIGLYGLLGAGKSFLLHDLESLLSDSNSFPFYEGSEVIDHVTPGGLSTFKTLPLDQQTRYREAAINAIAAKANEEWKTAIFTGHFSFPEIDHPNPDIVWTSEDTEKITHILYIDVPAAVIFQRQGNDLTRERTQISIQHLHAWQASELDQIREICYQHQILFSVLKPDQMQARARQLVMQRLEKDDKNDMNHLKKSLGSAVKSAEKRPGLRARTMLVIDADRTLAPQDSGSLFCEHVTNTNESSLAQETPLKALLQSQLGYSRAAFQQMTLLCEDVANDEEFEAICANIAQKMTLYPEFKTLLHSVRDSSLVGAVIVTCGLRRVWEEVVERECPSSGVSVIGGGRLKDGLVMTPAFKAAAVTHLRECHRMHVIAIGDSPLDLDMMKAANQAIVIVGEEHKRSKSMDAALESAIATGLKATQVLLPESVKPRLNKNVLPIGKLPQEEFERGVQSWLAQ